jgi:lipoprotein-anchoring transpeptidase ErfK/SrfK
MRRVLTALVALICLLAAGAGSGLAAVELQRPAQPPVVLAVAALDSQPAGSAQQGAQASASSQPQQSNAQTVTICPCKSGKRIPAPPPAPVWGSAPDPIGGVPNVGGSVILVSIRQQWLWAYRNGTLIYATAVTTGRPELPTPIGFFSVKWRVANTTFYSPWPPSSPYYYPPEHVNYALYFADYGFFIHDAPWRHCFGPGTNVPHTCPDGTTDTGSHGCVNVPTSAGAWLYANMPNGAAVIIRG